MITLIGFLATWIAVLLGSAGGAISQLVQGA